MKLIETIINIILEASRRPKLRYINKDPKNFIELISTYHQWFERHGDLTLDDIKYLYYENGGKYRVGVPDEIITNLFKKNINKITEAFKTNNIPRIIFIKKNNDNEDEEIFDNSEFIIGTRDTKTYNIITSAFSSDGNYLRNVNKDPRLQIENQQYNDLLVIYL